MRYIVHNLKSLCKKEPFLFLVMLISIVSSAVIMLFSYGLYQHYHVQRYETEVDAKELTPTLQENAELRKEDLVRYLSALSDDTRNAMDVIYTSARLEEFPAPYYTEMPFRFTIQDGTYGVSQITKQNWENRGLMVEGRYITDAEEAAGANAALVCYYSEEMLYNEATQAILNDDQTITLFGKQYQIVGIYNAGGGTPIVSFLSVPDSLQLSGLAFMFRKNITNTQYQDIVTRAQNEIPGVLMFEDLDFPDAETVYLYNNIMLIAALIAVLTVINFAVLYRFIVAKRMREIAVMRICGCTVGKAFAICLGECCLLCISTYLLGIAVYIPFMKQVLSKLFPYMLPSYSGAVYLVAFLLYALIMLLIVGTMLLVQLHRKPVEAWKDGVVS